MAKLSVIFAVYNGSRFIGAMVENISRLTYDDVEVICVVDSRSTDGSLETFSDEISKHPGWKMLVQTDDGRLGSARNMGIEAATGEYIWCCDIDDSFEPDMASLMIDAMERYDADIARCNYMRIMSSEYDGILPEIPEHDYRILTMDRDEALHARFEERISLTTWSMIFRRKFIDQGLRFISGGVAEDDYFAIMTLSRADRVCYFERPLYYYIFDEKAGWRVRSTAEEKKAVYDELVKDFIERDDPMTAELRSFSIRLALHEAVWMDEKGFLEFTRTPEFLDEYRRYCLKNRTEMFVFLHFPRLYYRLAKRLIFSKGQPKVFNK